MADHHGQYDLGEFDGELFESWRIEQGHMVRVTTQPREDRILEMNQYVRNNPEILHDLGGQKAGEGGTWGRLAGRIPRLHFLRLVKKYPELMSFDMEIRTRAVLKLLNSREGELYRLQPRNLRRG